MTLDRPLSYIWCALAAGVILVSTLPGGGWVDQTLGNSDISRWAHFMAYATVVVIPFLACRKAKSVFLPLAVVLAGIMLETVETLIPGSAVHPQNVLANMFGVGAGILLGINLRMMRNAARADKKLDIENSRPTLL